MRGGLARIVTLMIKWEGKTPMDIFSNIPISWCSKKQTVVVLSSCEAEYIVVAERTFQCIWLESVQFCVDNQSTINLAKNLISHGRSKHIETMFHFLREQVGKGKLGVKHCNTKKQVTDIFTKPLRLGKFEELREWIRARCITKFSLRRVLE